MHVSPATPSARRLLPRFLPMALLLAMAGAGLAWPAAAAWRAPRVVRANAPAAQATQTLILHKRTQTEGPCPIDTKVQILPQDESFVVAQPVAGSRSVVNGETFQRWEWVGPQLLPPAGYAFKDKDAPKIEGVKFSGEVAPDHILPKWETEEFLTAAQWDALRAKVETLFWLEGNLVKGESETASPAVSDTTGGQAADPGEEFPCYGVKFRPLVLGIDLDVDSDNDDGRGAADKLLDESPEEEFDEEKDDGKVFCLNQNDDDEDGIPDYADWKKDGGRPESGLVPVVVKIPARLKPELDKLEVVFDYPGGVYLRRDDKEYTYDAEGRQTAEAAVEYPPNRHLLQQMTHAGLTSFKLVRDWRESSVGPLRLWQVQENRDPGTEKSPTDLCILPGGARSAAVFFKDAEETADKATGEQVLRRVLWLEGTKEVLRQRITASLRVAGTDGGASDTVVVTAVDLNAGFNSENAAAVADPGGASLLPCTPDVEWRIDAFDEVTEDQGRGYPLWASYAYKQKWADGEGLTDEFGPRSQNLPPGREAGMRNVPGTTIDPMEIEDVHPLVLHVPDSVMAIRPKNKVVVGVTPLDGQASHGDWQIDLYDGAVTNRDFTAFRRDAGVAEKILRNAKKVAEIKDTLWTEIPVSKLFRFDNGDVILLAVVRSRHNETKKALDKSYPIQDQAIAFEVGLEPMGGPGARMLGDGTKCWMGENFYAMYSFWDNDVTPRSSPPTTPYVWSQAGHYTETDRNPQLDGVDCSCRNALVKYHNLHIHGYNYSNQQAAADIFYQYWKREYLAGFRGNFIGMTWPSGVDRGLFAFLTRSSNPFTTSEGALNRAEFGANIHNALRVGPVMSQFVKTVLQPKGATPELTDIYAHSLGTMAAWEMLKASDGPLARNFFGSESAMYPESLEPTPNSLAYVPEYDVAGGQFRPGPGRLVGAYLSNTTWYGRYADVMGKSLVPQGEYHHGYNPYDDPVWNKFRFSDWMLNQYGQTSVNRILVAQMTDADATDLGVAAAKGLVVNAYRVFRAIGAGNVTVEDKSERTLSEEKSAALFASTENAPSASIGEGMFTPRVQMNRNGPMLSESDPTDALTGLWTGGDWFQARQLNGLRPDDLNNDGYPDNKTVNSLAFDVPGLLELNGVNNYGRTQVTWNSTTQQFQLAYPPPRTPAAKLPQGTYLYTHLREPHGVRESPLENSAFKPRVHEYNMQDYNWREWHHGGHTDQSLPSADRFYYEILYGNGRPQGGCFRRGSDSH